MMDEFYTRAMLVKNRVDRLVSEAKRCDDPTRIEEIRDEVAICEDSLHAIREEQLIAMLPKSQSSKRRWWRR